MILWAWESNEKGAGSNNEECIWYLRSIIRPSRHWHIFFFSYWHIHLRQIKFSLKTEPLFFLTTYAIFSLRSSLYQNMVSTNLPSLKMELKVYETFTRVASALRLDTWYLILDTWYFTIWFETRISVDGCGHIGGCAKRPIIDIGKKLVQSFPPSAAVAWGSS